MTTAEEQLDALKIKYEESLKELEALKVKSNNVSETDWDTDATGDATIQLGARRRRPKKKPGAKKQSLKGVLNKHEYLLKEIGNKTFEENDGDMLSLMNSLSKTNIKKALDNESRKHGLMEPEQIEPPKIEKNINVTPNTLKDCIQCLRDAFKIQFSGRVEEDIEGLFFTANQLAETFKLSKSQYYTLLKSRTQMGSSLYNEIRLSEIQNAPLQDLMNNIIPVFGVQHSYISSLNKLNNYKPPPNTEPNIVYSQVKLLTTNLAMAAKPECVQTFVYQNLKQKLISLYPSIANTLLEKEEIGAKSTARLARIFLALAPIPNNKARNAKDSVYEISEETSYDTVHVIKISDSIVRKLQGRCYKCASEGHFGKDCPRYVNCQLAYYLCSKCKQAVHLPKDCRQEESVNIVSEDNVTFEVIDENNSDDSKNLL